MREWIELQQRLVPDLLEVMAKRYVILSQVMKSESIGRRALAAALSMTERTLRAEADFLKAQGLLEANAAGMRITDAGRRLVESLAPFMSELSGLSELERLIREHFRLREVIVVPGDADEARETKRELGRAAGRVLIRSLQGGDVVAVTGGTTLAALAETITVDQPLKGVLFVPARGGFGESMDYQANTIASTLAKRTGAAYRLLHVPDHLSEDAYQSLMLEPNVREMVEVIRKSRIVVHGIGDAMVMARRRKVDARTMDAMRAEGALAEALGYYFDKSGTVIHRMSTVGLRLDDLEKAEHVIAVAGGSSKGEAIAAVLRYGQDDVLVTDEGAARRLEAIIRQERQQADG
jgi:central glycolytic genes regulator